MDTARPASSTTTQDQLPPAAADPEVERIAKLRQMLADEGFDPDEVLGSRPLAVTAVDDSPTPAAADPEVERIAKLRQMLADEGLAEGEVTGAPRPAPEANGLHNAVVDFRGRMIEVAAPEIEQVMVIRRMQTLFANAAKIEEISADEAIRLMDRALKAVCSVVVHPDDVEFLEDLLLTRQARLEDTLPLLRESMQALEKVNADRGNRAERRAARSSGRAGRAALVTSAE